MQNFLLTARARVAESILSHEGRGVLCTLPHFHSGLSLPSHVSVSVFG